jgi:hypothetical protein
LIDLSALERHSSDYCESSPLKDEQVSDGSEKTGRPFIASSVVDGSVSENDHIITRSLPSLDSALLPVTRLSHIPFPGYIQSPFLFSQNLSNSKSVSLRTTGFSKGSYSTPLYSSSIQKKLPVVPKAENFGSFLQIDDFVNYNVCCIFCFSFVGNEEEQKEKASSRPLLLSSSALSSSSSSSSLSLSTSPVCSPSSFRSYKSLLFSVSNGVIQRRLYEYLIENISLILDIEKKREEALKKKRYV